MTGACSAAGNTEAILGHRARHRRRWGRSCDRSRSGTFGSLIGFSARRCGVRGQLGAGPGEERLVLDIDSFIGEVHGQRSRAPATGTRAELGYHPLLATRADTSEILHVRLRKGQAHTQRGALRFVDELLARVSAPARPG